MVQGRNNDLKTNMYFSNPKCDATATSLTENTGVTNPELHINYETRWQPTQDCSRADTTVWQA